MLGVGRATLLAEGDSPRFGSGSERAFEALIERRASGVPVAYLRGLKEFHGLALSVDERALIPRPETELLVELALGVIARRLTDAPREADARPVLVWDVGTGSGAIVIALAVECRGRGYGADVAFRATDVSPDALALATENAVGHGVADVIGFATADLTDLPDVEPVDLIVANLPYVRTAETPTLPLAASYEPRSPLMAATTGWRWSAAFWSQLPQALVADGVALLEIGSDQAEALSDAVASALPGWTLADP